MLTTSLLIAASFAVGQDVESPVYEHLKDLECFIGTWEAKLAVPESPAASENLKKWAGKTALLRMTVRWAPGKSAQIIEEVHDIPGEMKITGTTLRGWDQSAQKIKDSSFTTHKGVWSGIWEKQGDAWVVEYTGFNLDGAKCEGVQEINVINKDTLVMTDKRATIDGKAYPNTECKYTRVKGNVRASNYEKLKALEPLVGTWEGKSSNGTTARWTLNWTEDKNEIQNVLTVYRPDGAFQFKNVGVFGWDPVERRITNWCVTDNGKQIKFCWGKRDDGKLETWPPGSQSAWTVTLLDEDTWKMEGSDGAFTYKRVRK